MNMQFQLNTTVSDPLQIVVDSRNTTMKELHEKLYNEVLTKTIFEEEDILDIFAQQSGSFNGTLSIKASEQLVKDFIPMNRDYFPFDAASKTMHKLYVIDRMYNERIKMSARTKQSSTKREIKTSHIDGFILSTKRFVSSLW